MRYFPGMVLLIGAVALSASLSACGPAGLRAFDDHGSGPDAFLIVPKDPLQTPENLSALPAPTPGGSNLTDRDPEAEAIAALGGRLSTGEGVPQSDAALVAASSRYGVEGGIRNDLADEDLAKRKRNAFIARFKLFDVDRYAEVYARDALRPAQVAQSYRNAGVPTPSAPPAGE